MNVISILFLTLLFTMIASIILKKQKSVIMLAIIVFGIIIVITGICFFNTPFKDNVNMQLNPTDSHKYTIDNKVYYLPLPPQSTLKYRTSDESAVYMTKSNLDEIVNLYRNVSNNGTFNESKDNNRALLSFEYNDYRFNISVEICDKLRKLFVSGNHLSHLGT